MSLDWLPSADGTLRASSAFMSGKRPRSASWRREQLPLREQSFRADQFQPNPGERDRAERFRCGTAGAVLRRRVPNVPGGAGAGLGVRNLSCGFMVMKYPSRMEVSEALLSLRDFCMGTHRVLTVWPGRYGHLVVEGRDGSWVSVAPSSSY
jgi:hypothetical protein